MEETSSNPKTKRVKHAAQRPKKATTITERRDETQQTTKDPPPSDYKKLNFLPGKRLVPSQIEESNVLDLFNFQEWIDFLRYGGSVYKLEVALFYTNLKYEAGKLHSKVHGVPITITTNLLAKLFNIPNKGLCIWVESTKWPKGVSEHDCITELLNDGPSGNDYLTVMPSKYMLSADKHILHIFADKALLPRDRKDGFTDKMLGFFMWKVLRKEPLNLPFYIIQHMAYTDRVGKVGLPYARHLTKVFEHFKVPLTEESVMKFNHNWDLTLKQLKQSKIYLHKSKFITEAEFQSYGSKRRDIIVDHMDALSDLRQKYEEVDSDDDVEGDGETRRREPIPRGMTNVQLYEALSVKFEGLETRVNELKVDVSRISTYLQDYGFRPSGYDGATGSGHTTMEE